MLHGPRRIGQLALLSATACSCRDLGVAVLHRSRRWCPSPFSRLLLRARGATPVRSQRAGPRVAALFDLAAARLPPRHRALVITRPRWRRRLSGQHRRLSASAELGVCPPIVHRSNRLSRVSGSSMPVRAFPSGVSVPPRTCDIVLWLLAVAPRLFRMHFEDATCVDPQYRQYRHLPCVAARPSTEERAYTALGSSKRQEQTASDGGAPLCSRHPLLPFAGSPRTSGGGIRIRDWGLGARPFSICPLGAPSLPRLHDRPCALLDPWAIRVTVGPWFDNLPHAGGLARRRYIDGRTLLLAAVWRAAVVVPRSDHHAAPPRPTLVLAPLFWNPVWIDSAINRHGVGAPRWHHRSLGRLAAITASLGACTPTRRLYLRCRVARC